MSSHPLSRLLNDAIAPDRPVARRHGHLIDARHFARHVGALARDVRRRGHRRAVLACQDSYHFAVGLFGLLHGGSTVILTPHGQPGTMPAEHDGLIDDAAVAEAGDGSATFDVIDTERPAFEFFTSGSSGTPKQVWKTLGHLEREVAVLDRHWGDAARCGTVQATVSHQHAYGLPFKILWPLSSGRVFAAETHEVWETLLPELGHGDILISSPAHLGRLGGLTAQPSERRVDRIFSAGAPLLAADSAQAEIVFGRHPIEIFGSTESGVMASRIQDGGNPSWLPVHGVEVDRGPEGLMRLRSPHAAMAEWQETSDLIEFDGDGFKFIGRSDRIAKIEGMRISLDEVEAALLATAWVTEAVALALPGCSSRLAAIVVPSATGRDELAARGTFRFGRLLRQALAGSQVPAGLPKSWRFVDRLPVQPLGKRRQADLLALFGHMP